ncbi:transcriptional regulator [Pokkaliibacter plantistimulans]|uniref:Transcriptional regulator n=2 Tax=Pseudomonadota TaxID=1224 RepID=A0ABX5LRX6_9GAMM|nr:LysR family transcriptional regulator [Pokkaliibacter plantistimulans]PPC77811.1 LysR family transcriptional regulator [Pokkaliibacter plantistimulans]PXF29394.1 transcriptional regulator [Pokkaliibacter plantistimulans]
MAASSFGFDLKALEVFVQVVETGNLTYAAERLGLTQSSISQTLSNLERNLDAQLLDRSVRPLHVTTAGRFFYDRALQILLEARKTSQDMQRGHFKLRHVRIALVDSLATAIGRPLIEMVRKRTEDWSVSTGLSHMHAQSLLSRQVDIVISDDGLDDYDDLTRFTILREPMVIALPPHYTGDISSLAAIQKRLEFVRYQPHSLIGQSVERYLRRVQINLPPRLHLDNTYAIMSMVASGIGWTITTPLCLYQTGLMQHQVRCVPLPGEPVYRELSLVARRNELWDLPKVIAEDSCQILRERFLTDIVANLPWLEPQIRIGES